MPRNSSGTYTLPVSAFTPGETIRSSDTNSNNNDIATALTQSLATTGVSSMAGPILGAAGSATAPGYTFSSSKTDGFYLAGTHQIGLATNGIQAATFNSDQSVTWAGNASWAGNISVTGTTTLTGAVTLNATTYTFGAGALAGWYTAVAPSASVGMVIDAAGAVVSTGQKGQIYIPFPMTITKWWVMADQSGSVTVDVLRANNGVPSSSIVGGGTAPNLSSSQFTSAAPASWTSTTLAANDFIAFNITGSPLSVTRVAIYLSGLRTGS